MPLRESHLCSEYLMRHFAAQADALPELEHRVEDYSAKVEGHLRRMGLPA